jgi:heat shock protein HslJ
MNVSKAFLILLTAFLSACSLNDTYQGDDALIAQLVGDDSNASHILNDIWALESMAGEALVLDNSQRPQLEIHLREMTLNGHDGCNNFFGSIEFIDNKSIIFGPVGSTRMYCQPMDIADRFNQQFSRIKTYELNGLRLKFLDAQGEELLQFVKID